MQVGRILLSYILGFDLFLILDKADKYYFYYKKNNGIANF